MCRFCQSEATIHIEAVDLRLCASCLEKIDARIAAMNAVKDARDKMNFANLNREVMETIRIMEDHLQTFHGYRHLWAKKIALHESCGVSEAQLQKEQLDALSMVIGHAHILAQQFGLKWETCEITREESRRLLREAMAKANGK